MIKCVAKTLVTIGFTGLLILSGAELKLQTFLLYAFLNGAALLLGIKLGHLNEYEEEE